MYILKRDMDPISRHCIALTRSRALYAFVLFDRDGDIHNMQNEIVATVWLLISNQIGIHYLFQCCDNISASGTAHITVINFFVSRIYLISFCGAARHYDVFVSVHIDICLDGLAIGIPIELHTC